MGKFVPTWRLVIWIVLGPIALAIGGIYYTNVSIAKAIHESEGRRCASVRDQVEFYRQKPPETERQFAAQDYWLNREQEVCGPLEGS